LVTIFAQIEANGKDIPGRLLTAAAPFIITHYRRFDEPGVPIDADGFRIRIKVHRR
jgi:hypothetical protein